MAKPPADLEVAAGGAGGAARSVRSGAAPDTRTGHRIDPRWQRVVRLGFLVLAVGLGGLAVISQWEQVRASLGQLGFGALAFCFAAAIAGSIAAMLVWRALLADLGSDLPVRPAAKVFFVGQLGKYVPGAIWPMVAQMELGHRIGLPRRRSAAAFVLTMLVVFTSALFVASAALPLLGRDGTAGYRWLLVLTPLIAGLLHPRVLNRLLGLFFRLLRREPLERPLSGRGVIRAFGWALVAWAWFGLHVAVLVTELDVPVSQALPLALGAFAIAWCAGPVVMIAPAGAGVRELALVALLAPVLDPAGALVVALASRLFLTVADLLLAGLAALAAIRQPAGGRVGQEFPTR